MAGQIDCLFLDPGTQSMHMVDWKRCAKDMDPTSGEVFGRYGKQPCDFLLDNKFSHYAAQQNLYAAILHDCYGLPLASMSLVQIHPDLKSYRVLGVPSFMEIARSMLQCSKGASEDATFL